MGQQGNLAYDHKRPEPTRHSPQADPAVRPAGTPDPTQPLVTSDTAPTRCCCGVASHPPARAPGARGRSIIHTYSVVQKGLAHVLFPDCTALKPHGFSQVRVAGSCVVRVPMAVGRLHDPGQTSPATLDPWCCRDEPVFSRWCWASRAVREACCRALVDQELNANGHGIPLRGGGLCATASQAVNM